MVPNGGADLIYLPGKPMPGRLAGDIVKFLTTQDYVSGIFVNDRLGKFPGALEMSKVGLMGDARTPRPSIMVNFRSDAGDCDEQAAMHGGGQRHRPQDRPGQPWSLSRAETRNFMAAIGPDFKTGFADPAPISNADITPTLARIAGIELAPKGKLRGRVITRSAGGRCTGDGQPRKPCSPIRKAMSAPSSTANRWAMRSISTPPVLPARRWG